MKQASVMCERVCKTQLGLSNDLKTLYYYPSFLISLFISAFLGSHMLSLRDCCRYCMYTQPLTQVSWYP